MSRLSMNFTRPEARRRGGPLTALGQAILFGVCIGALASLAFHLLGVGF